MGLETISRPVDLNQTWPLPGDLAATTDEHLRLIKQAIKMGFLGKYLTLDICKEIPMTYGFFLYNGNFYEIEPTGRYVNDDVRTFQLNNNMFANQVSNPTILGLRSSKGPQLPIAGSRLPGFFTANVLSDEFDSGIATTSTGGSPVLGDFCLQVRNEWSETRYYTGITWTKVNMAINGYVSFGGNVSIGMLSSKKVNSVEVRAQYHVSVGSSHVEVSSAEGFGPDSLRYWFGLASGVVASSGEVAFNTLTKTNAIEWKTFTEASVNGAGTPVDGGLVLDSLGMGTAYSGNDIAYNSGECNASLAVTIGVNGLFSVTVGGTVTVGTPVSGNYVTTPSPATGFLYEVMFETVSGTTPTGTLASWQALSQSRTVSMDASVSGPGLQTRSGVVRIRVRKTGDAGTEKSVEVGLTVQAQSVSGSMP